MDLEIAEVAMEIFGLGGAMQRLEGGFLFGVVLQ